MDLDGKGAVAKGGVCDTGDDCASDVCALTDFNESTAKYAICTNSCTSDAQCSAGQVCTTAFDSNFCTPKCTKNTECPVDFSSNPPAGSPWKYLTCTVATGKCK